MFFSPLNLDRETKIFLVFILLHLMCWTLVPTWMRFNLPMDSIEGTIWAQKLVLGYDKAPLLNGWITALALQWFGYVDWGIYLTSQLSVVICFTAVWQLAKKMLTPMSALLAVVILEGFQYYHIGAIDFDDNVLQLPLWGLTCLFFYQALTESKWRHWFFLGLCAGLAMLAKYYVVLLFISFFLLLYRPENRHFFKEKKLYFSLIVFLVVILPHVIWLFRHDFLTIHYVFRRIGDAPTWLSHCLNPCLFLRDEIYALIVPGLLFWILWAGKSEKSPFLSGHHLKPFDRNFLLYLAFGPFLLAVALSFITGIKLHIMWGSALFSLWGIVFIGLFCPIINPQAVRRFFIAVSLLFLSILLAYAVSLKGAKNHSSAHFPGQVIANAVTQRWQQRYHQPLAYVVGERWLAGNVSFYSTDHPLVFIEAKLSLMPWLNWADFKRKGWVLIWDVDKYGSAIPENYGYLIGKQSIDSRRWSEMKVGVSFGGVLYANKAQEGGVRRAIAGNTPPNDTPTFISLQRLNTQVMTFTWYTAKEARPIRLGVFFSEPSHGI